MRFPFLYVLRFKPKLDVSMQMIDAGGGDLCAALSLGQHEGALENRLRVQSHCD
jgi:hypothetical protein